MTVAISAREQRHTKPGAASLRAGALLLGALAGLSLFARIALEDPNAADLTSGGLPPLSRDHLLGTDVLGRDLLTWCANGVLTSLSIGVLVVLISTFAGVLVGAFSGYTGGWVDTVLMRIVDLNLAVPPLLIFLAAAMMVQRNLTTMVVLLASVSWVPYARLVRATVLVERERSYISAARLAGSGPLKIVFGHLVPASATPIVVFASLHLGFVMLSEAALSFIGMGFEPPTASLGYMISEGQDQLTGAWWIATVPGLAIVLLILAANLIGDGLRDRFHVDTGGTV